MVEQRCLASPPGPQFGSEDSAFTDPVHLSWLEQHRASLLDFYQPQVCLEGAGYAYLSATGKALPHLGSQLWLGARMLHVFAVAHALGREGAAQVAEHGIEFYTRGAGRDHQHGGWFATVGGDAPNDHKELYGQAHVLLAASSAVLAGFDNAGTMLSEALDLIDTRYWVEAEGRARESYDREFRVLDPYRGQNANMHLAEALLAAHEATGDDILLERAARIAGHIAGPAAAPDPGAWRLPEHFNSNWEPLPEFNRDQPRHPFRPYGSQPGHWLEWAKLIMHMRNLGVDEPWMLPAAEHLYRGAFSDGWADNGGFVYTVDWEGTPVVRERFFWEPAEGVGAARFLHAATGDFFYEDTYRAQWAYIDAHIADHEDGAWFHEVDEDNVPVTHTWPGKPDLYHAFQATLPADSAYAAWAVSRGQQ